MKVNDSSSYMLMVILNYSSIIVIWRNGVIILFMIYLKSPSIKFGIIEMFVDVKKIIVLYIFKMKQKKKFVSNFVSTQSNFIFQMVIFFIKCH
jgi:hypothetical protein